MAAEFEDDDEESSDDLELANEKIRNLRLLIKESGILEVKNMADIQQSKFKII